MSGDRFNEYCEALLVRYNRRNTQTVTSRLEDLCRFLRQEGNHVVQTMFGGSVRRGTYVTGLSDVDVLLIVNESSLVNQPPSEVIAYVRDTIGRRLRQNSVSAGDLAVTVCYSDGTEIQILPAIRRTAAFGLPSPEAPVGAGWRTPRDSPRSSGRSTRQETAGSFPQSSSRRPLRTASSDARAERSPDTTWSPSR